MEPCILRQVNFDLPGTRRLLWALVVGQSEGVSLLFVKRPDENRSHMLALAVENVEEGFFEAGKVSQFPVGQADLAGIGSKLQALAENLFNEEFRRQFRGAFMAPVGVQVRLTGSNNSALVRVVKVWLMPPTANAFPFASNVVVCKRRASCKAPASVNEPVVAPTPNVLSASAARTVGSELGG